MSAPISKTSIWLALRNPVFRSFWLATVVSGVCIAAHNTAAFYVLGKMENSTVVISLMATVSALPFTIFTLPAGALADMVNRKWILCTVNLWQAGVAIGLAIIGLTNALNSYIILTSAFLFSLGFAFGSPASTSVVNEMASREELASAHTLGGLQINISGMIGPVLGGLLISVMGVSSVFAANGIGFLLMFLAILRWKPVRAPARVPMEDFVGTVLTAIRYVRYEPGIKVILVRNTIFAFFISIIPAMLPVVALKQLGMDSTRLGLVFTSMGIGSVVGAVLLIPKARARFSPSALTIRANLLLISTVFLMALVRHPYAFLLVAALAGAGWTLSASELWIAAQRAMPDWAAGRLNGIIVMLSQGATALGGAIWGAAATWAGVDRTLIVTAFVAIVFATFIDVVLRKRLSIDFTAELNLEPATMTPFSHDLDPTRLTQAKENPISLITEFRIDPTRRVECMELMHEARMIYLRNGAYGWHLYEDLKQSNHFQMEVLLPAGRDYERQRERMTQDDQGVLDSLSRLRIEPQTPVELPRVCVDREVIQKQPKSRYHGPDDVKR